MSADRCGPEPGPVLRSEKIRATHLERLAVVYVRQSTLQQVLDHQESTRLQYGLVNRAVALGWAAERVLTIDEDLGKSGSSAIGREGFARLVGEVSLGHVGLILGLEMSRLARSCKDWHHLLELCALFGTLIADLDGVYDPYDPNDKLLLGVKGTLSEAELHLIKQRLHQGKLNKARRGELHFALPIGYWRGPAGDIRFDPDEHVQQVVRLVFRKFDELGTLHALLRYLVKHDIQLGVRVREGEGKGELSWRRPNRMTLQNMLKHPIYAGAYTYGRRQIDPRKCRPGQPRSGRVTCELEDYHALRQDDCPAYISWAQYRRNRARLKANRARSDAIGAVRHGPALLAGLLVCGSCGQRMNVHYGGPRQLHSYVCDRNATSYGSPYCQYLPGPAVDAFVSHWVLKALEPAALELSLAAAAHLEHERAELDQLWQQRLERAAFETQRAGRHYRHVEPEHRLVARQLAKDWEAKLAAEQQLQEDYRRFTQQSPRVLSASERDAIRALAVQLPMLWDAATTTVTERKEMIRQVIQQIRLQNDGVSERLHVRIDWVDGSQTTGVVIRPISRTEHLSYYPQLCARIAALVHEGVTVDAIADTLAQEGYRPARAAERFSPQAVRVLIRRLGLRHERHHKHGVLDAHEWWLADLAQTLGMPASTLHRWLQRGEVKARRHPATQRWIVWADTVELARLQQRRNDSVGDLSRQRWLDAAPLPSTTL